MNRSILTDLINKGYSQRELASELGCSRATIRHWLNKYDLKTRSRKRYYGGRDEEYKLARQLRKEGYGYRAISKKMNSQVPWKTVCNWVSDIKVDSAIAHEKWNAENEIPISELKSKRAIRVRLLETRGNVCEWCKNTEWLGNPITIEMHRINGKDSPYSDVENIVLLCPNCHSTTPDYKNKSG